MWQAFIILHVFLFILLKVANAQQSYDFEQHRGIYAFISAPDISSTSERNEEYDKAIRNAGVDGVFIKFSWDKIETAPNQYTWTNFDKWIVKAVQAGKKVSFGIAAGASSPAWLLQAPYSVPSVYLSWDKTNGRGTGGAADCISERLPLPWNATFKYRYIKMITAARDRLRVLSVPGQSSGAAFNAVTIVKLGGVNKTSVEAMVPRNSPESLKKCGVDNDRNWQNAGFTFDRMRSAWSQMAEDIGPLFVNRKMSLAVISAGAFPPVDQNGRVNFVSGDVYDDITKSLIDFGQGEYGGRFVLQWNALGEPNNSSITELIKLSQGGRVGWQLNQRGDTGTGCGEDFHECSAAEYKNILMRGAVDFRADFLEVHSYDAARFPASVFQDARNVMKNR